MKQENANEKKVEKKSSKKPLAAVAVIAALALGAFGANQYFNTNNDDKPAVVEDESAKKEKVTIKVKEHKVYINDQEQTLAEGQDWKALLEAYFAKKDMAKTEVVVDYAVGDKVETDLIKKALTDLKINATETTNAK